MTSAAVSGPPPRYRPELPLPARPYRLGRGWARPQPALTEAPPCREPWRHPSDLPAAGVAALRHGVDLFNAGCWWEAHEVWEGLWAGAERGSALRLLVQGLILLAAAHLQQECGHVRGAARLAARALERLEHLEHSGTIPAQRAPLGIPLATLTRELQRWPGQAPPGQPPAPATIRLAVPTP